jgi:hypothetical protein
MSDQNAGFEDSGDTTLMTQEQGNEADEQQFADTNAAGASEENPPENNEAVVEKRLRDTQAKITELAEQLKLANAKLEMVNAPRERMRITSTGMIPRF